ncbi:MAG: M56 family metallopeptidase, partial [Conexibacteraceae bacterium]|nr:M56 family metallopeptidase [Conexibacteraceae bacterium]
ANLSYPTANAAAIVVLCQAALGFAALTAGGRAALRELRASRRFNAWVRSRVAWVLDDALVIHDERPAAFCAGLLRPRIYVSTAAVATLDEQALGAVLDHERAHRHRHDPLRLSAGRVLVRALFFVPGVRRLAAHHESLAELSADEYAVAGSPHKRRALARAMLAFDQRPSAPQAAGIDPARVDALLGDGPAWSFPLLAFLAAAAIVVLMILTVTLIGRLATGAATLALPFLSGQPCVLMLALMPALLVWATRRLSRRRSAPTAPLH